MPEYFQGFLNNIVQSLVAYGPRIIGGLLILLVGWIISRWVVGASSRFFIKTDAIDKTFERYISRLLRFAVLAVTFVAALASFGVQTTSIIAILGAMGLAVGLALQGTLSNVASGLVLLYMQPFKVDEWVEIGGTVGQVREIGLFATELKTGDGLYVMIPNTKIWGDSITNYIRNGTRRVEMVFSVGYNDDLDRAVEIIKEVIDADERVLDEPEPFIKVAELGESSVDIYARPWTKVPDFFTVQLEVTKKVKERFDEEGVSIPFPQREIRLLGDGAREAA